MFSLLLRGRVNVVPRFPRCRGYPRLPRTLSTAPEKSFYITTPIFYPNASPHIGHLYTLVIGDVFARYQRICRGLPSGSTEAGGVAFLAGTDEHGMKIQKAAKKHLGVDGKEQEFCDSLTERFKDLGQRANVSNTMFMRTTSTEHRRAVEDVWRKLEAKGFIYKGNYSGWYSVTDECFYTDSQVTRVSTAFSPPASSTTTATFTSHQNPNPQPGSFQTISVESGSPVEWSEEENYMFRLKAFTEVLLDHYTSNPMSVYPEQYREDVLNTLRSGGAEDISISRPRSRLEWGIQVPGDPSQTVYVWFDALLIYLTGSGYPWSDRSGSTSPWPADLQVIGKDILKFHAIYLPAIIKALDAPSYSAGSSVLNRHQNDIPLAGTILTHAHWTSSQKKMSKSLGNVADPLQAIEQWGVDVVRFYLMRVGGRWRDDVDWSSTQLDKHFREVQAQLGNYFLRITSPRLSDRVSKALDNGELTIDNCISPAIKSLFDVDHQRGSRGSSAPRFIVNEDVDVLWRDVPSRTSSSATSTQVYVPYKKEDYNEEAGTQERPGFIQNEDVDVRWSEVPQPRPTSSSSNEPLDTPRPVSHQVSADDPNYILLKATLALPARVHELMETYEAGTALAEIVSVLRIANKTLTDIAPWSPNVSPQVIHTTRIVALETIHVASGCLEAFMPDTATKIKDALGVDAQRGNALKESLRITDGSERLKVFWDSWTGRDIKGVRLF